MMKYYFDLLSQPSRALWIFLKMTKVPAQFIKVDLGKAEHLTDKFKEINRFQKVPCIVDADGFKLSESVAIFRYITSLNDVPENWYPKDIKARALVDEYLEYQHNSVRLPCAMYFQTKWLIPRLSGNPIDEKKAAAYKKLMEQSLNNLENVWLESADRKFLASEEISFADILAACELEQPKMAWYDPFDGRPRLRSWYDRVRDATNPYYDEAHVVVKKVIEKNGKSKL
uniref:glutathione transferase n=1 Tax=Chironomus riparius TaxID=315576 RepID=F4MI64_9DIPT